MRDDKHADAGSSQTGSPASRDIQGDLPEPFGLHLVDMEVAMGNLIDLVGKQATSYLDSIRRR